MFSKFDIEAHFWLYLTLGQRRFKLDRDPLMAIYVISPQTSRLSEQIGSDTKPTEQMRRGFHPAWTRDLFYILLFKVQHYWGYLVLQALGIYQFLKEEEGRACQHSMASEEDKLIHIWTTNISFSSAFLSQMTVIIPHPTLSVPPRQIQINLHFSCEHILYNF